MSVNFAIAEIHLDAEFGEYAFQAEGTEALNLNNRNAHDVLALLGLLDEDEEWDLSGYVSGEDFLGRVLIALAGLDLTTDDANGLPRVTEGNFTEWGRQPHYLRDRLNELREMADVSMKGNQLISWC